jgi:hypothetical protein
MAKLTLKDDCLAPNRFVYLDYSGPDSFGVAKKIGGMLNDFFRVGSSSVGEYDFRWDRSGDPIGFFVRWWVKKEMSNFSTAWFHIQVQGNKAKETGEGSFTMEISAELKTSIENESPFFRAIWGLYSYFFYNQRRRDYINICTNLATGLRDEIKGHYNLRVKGWRGEQ